MILYVFVRITAPISLFLVGKHNFFFAMNRDKVREAGWGCQERAVAVKIMN